MAQYEKVLTEVLKDMQAWITTHGFRLLLILAAAWIAKKILVATVRKIERRFEQETGVPSETEKRAKTLTAIIHTTLLVAIYAIAIITIISELGIQIGPLLAGAGIAGLAIGFGAQSLVKDVINGFFLLLENQIRVGDVVEVGGIGGMVESINLRTIRLRDLQGRLHIIPHGSIDRVTNFTKDWSQALIEIGVAYKEDIDRVIEVLTRVGEELRNDPDFAPFILEPMTMQGVDSFGDSSVNLRMYFKTLPLKQWEVAREFRRRVKKAFDIAGIEIPFPHRTIYIGESQKREGGRIDASVRSADKDIR
ncbi:MAG: mechanosensitive ion channel family protein [Desulfobacterota bacterium]|nr:mechanosensitive ion channel family protein [Thermodesulfobacteriota bacterium]